MNTKQKFEAVSDMINAAYRTIEAAQKFVEDDATEPCWSVYQMLSSLSSALWTLTRIIKNQKTDDEPIQ